jgi:ABC-2 type transport system permease protein
VTLDPTYTQKVNQSIGARFINLLAYGLFSTIFSAYGLVNLAFNRPEVKMRNSCSPVSRRSFSRKISLATISYSFLATIGFSSFIIYISKLRDPQIIGLFSISIFAFFLAMVTFSTLITNLVKSSETISGVNNVFILGSCFISGVFVPSEFLPDIVNKIAAFTPTYWFVQSNMLIGESITYNQKFFEAIGLNLLVLLAFSAVFMVLNLMNMREKSLTSLISHKRTTR